MKTNLSVQRSVLMMVAILSVRMAMAIEPQCADSPERGEDVLPRDNVGACIQVSKPAHNFTAFQLCTMNPALKTCTEGCAPIGRALGYTDMELQKVRDHFSEYSFWKTVGQRFVQGLAVGATLGLGAAGFWQLVMEGGFSGLAPWTIGVGAGVLGVGGAALGAIQYSTRDVAPLDTKVTDDSEVRLVSHIKTLANKMSDQLSILDYQEK